MKKYDLTLRAEMSQSFYAQRAAQSLDINVEEKSLHEFSVTADLDSDYRVGLIVGASGSGKTTFARHVFGPDCFDNSVRADLAVIDQFPEEMDYDARSGALNAIGLTSVPCWLKPVSILSNGQRARAEAAIALQSGRSPVVLDEWTSVVDRTVAKVMSHSVQKFARKLGRRIVLVGCHYDVIEWLDPDWIVDCNSQRFVDRRLLRPDERERKERLEFTVREISSRSWPRFSQYHYLSKELAGGKAYYYGLFRSNEQVGFMAFSNYMPIRKGQAPTFHSNRVVVHPDYAGLGLGLKFVNGACRALHSRLGGYVDLRAAFSSVPMYRSRLRDVENWQLVRVHRRIGHMPKAGEKMTRKKGFRENVKMYSFKYIGGGLT